MPTANIAANQRRYKNSTRGKYIAHKINAKQRGIPFKLSFEDWYKIWHESGYWEKRGNKKGCYVMSRIGDNGAYKIGNVFIYEFHRNFTDGKKKIKRKPGPKPNKKKPLSDTERLEKYPWINDIKLPT